MSSGAPWRLYGCSHVTARRSRGLAQPDAPLPDSRSAPPDDPAATIRLRGSIARADVGSLCAGAALLIAACPPEGDVVCDVDGVAPAALPAVAVIARVALVARRNRKRMRLEHASPALIELLGLCGIAQLLDDGREDRGN